MSSRGWGTGKDDHGYGRDAVQFVRAGDRFGRLTVTDPAVRKLFPSVPVGGQRAAVCACDCGNQVTVTLTELIRGGTSSCGCAHREGLSRRLRKHGLADHPLYATHQGIMQRCYLPEHVHFRNYGGRGIRVCDEWRDVAAFIGWVEANLGPRPAGMTLDRIDNDGNYEPGNMRWATPSEQRRNQRARP